MPIDSDGDGDLDEDGPDDLDGDGHITSMRKKVPLGEGNFREMQDHPGIMERVNSEQQGDYLMLGSEGVDNDGDGPDQRGRQRRLRPQPQLARWLGPRLRPVWRRRLPAIAA